jgi:hypothetical protein
MQLGDELSDEEDPFAEVCSLSVYAAYFPPLLRSRAD